MTKQRKLFVGCAVLVLGASVAAQQGGRSQQQPASGEQMSMADMMKGCRDHCDRTSKGMDEMASAMKAARDSSEPAAMRGAMDRMDKAMADMKEHMGMCMRMMNMHGKGGMAGMMGGMMGEAKPAETPAARPRAGLDIEFSSRPNPPRTGENTFEVVIKDAQGKAITDAAVVLSVHMGAMPSMNMPEMRSSVALEHAGDGRYRGTGNVAMAGLWDVTVSVSKGGKEIGRRKLKVTAR